MIRWASLIGILFLLGCAIPYKGGHASFQSPGFSGGVAQPENPQDITTGEYVEVRPDGTKITWTTKIGAAQKNSLGEAVAKLKSLRPVMFVGIGLFIFGVASLSWPPLKLIVGSATTSAIAIVAGIALTILPTVVVGNEILILAIGVGGVGLYWFSHRHGELRGKLGK